RQSHVEFELLNMQFRYNSHTVYQTFANLQDAGRRAYRNFLLLDYCFILFFLVVMAAITLKLTIPGSFRTIVLGMVVMRAVLDVLENSILIGLLHSYPQQHSFWANLCSWFTTFKFIALYLWLAAVVFLLIRKLF
ncbi:MAG: hypothetical protein SVM86_02110, partial [Candidatus Cloacimonadota bacterium]|nr:hypothetical protein [Candidatus Cloacimonadota bacterium]